MEQKITFVGGTGRTNFESEFEAGMPPVPGTFCVPSPTRKKKRGNRYGAEVLEKIFGFVSNSSRENWGIQPLHIRFLLHGGPMSWSP